MADPYGLSASGIPPEMIAEYMGLQRRKQIADAMMGQSMQPIEVPQSQGRLAAKSSPFAAIAKVLQAYGAKQMQGENDTAQAGLFKRQGDEQSAAMAGYQRMREGTPGVTPLTPNDDEGNAMPTGAVKANPRQAIVQALTNPALRGNPVVAADLAAQRKREEAYTLAPGAKRLEGADVIATNAPKPQEHIINGKLYVAGPDGTLVEKGGPGAAPDPNKPFNPDGTPNPAYQEYEKGKAAAGATRVQTNVDTGKKFHEHLQAAVGDQIAGAASQARGALGTLNTVSQIREALDSGKVSAGPGTTAGQWLGQVGQVLGVSGKDAAEQLTQTRTVVQGLAQLELDAAQQMKGQGAITEAERGIIKRAAAGDIDGMTLPELRTLTDIMDRSARYKIGVNQTNVEKLKKQPGAASVVEYMDIPMPPAYQPKRRAADNQPVLRFDEQGNPIK